MSCLELQLTLQRDTDGYAVNVTSPAGEASSPLTLDPDFVSETVARARQARLAPEAGADIGRTLFDALFPGSIRERYRESLGIARERQASLAVDLRCDVPSLAALPWELLWDPVEDRCIAASQETPFTRYVTAPRRLPPPAPPPLRLLLVSASPNGWPPIADHKEFSRIESALKPLTEQGLIEIRIVRHASLERFNDALQWKPEILHITAHGRYGRDGNGELVLEDRFGDPLSLSASDLASLLSERDIRLVVLMACDTAGDVSTGGHLSGIGPLLVRAGIASVVTLQRRLPDGAALEFSDALYHSLAGGEPLGVAINLARRAIRLAGGHEQVDWYAPILHTREPCDPLIAPSTTAEPEKLDDTRTRPRKVLLLAAVPVVIALAVVSGYLLLHKDHPAPPPVSAATASPAGVITGPELLNDTFDDPAKAQLPTTSSDPAHVQIGYEGGEYVIRSPDPNWHYVAAAWIPQIPVTDVAIDVDARLSGDSSRQIVMLHCRFNPTDVTGYRLLVRTDNRSVEIDREDKGKSTRLFSTSGVSAIKPGTATNHLELICRGDTLTARVNGIEVGTIRDRTYPAGITGLAVSTVDNASKLMDARFDNLVLRDLRPGARVATPTSAPTPTPSDVLLADNFDDVARAQLPTQPDFPAQERMGYDAGEYDMARTDPNWNHYPAVFVKQIQVPDVSITIDARIAGDPANQEIVLHCRENLTTGTGYRLVVVPSTSQFALQRWDTNQWIDLIPLTASTAIKAGNGTNHIELICQGATLTARINGTQAGVAHDSTYATGITGFGVASTNDQPSLLEARFDNLVVRKAQPQASAEPRTGETGLTQPAEDRRYRATT